MNRWMIEIMMRFFTVKSNNWTYTRLFWLELNIFFVAQCRTPSQARNQVGASP